MVALASGRIGQPPTTVLAVEPTTTRGSDTATSATPTSTSVENSESHVVKTVEEAEEILRELWFGWFEGIYNQDEDRIREVVATEAMLESAVAAFGKAYDSPPSYEDVLFSGSEVLRSDEECLVVWSTIDISGFAGPGASESSLYVLRSDGSWLLATVWVNREDLWEPDCDSLLLPLP